MASHEPAGRVPEISVVIVNWNVRDLLLDAIASVYASAPGRPIEIIVVDNASADGSVEAVRARYPEVVTVANRDNPGFTRANNQGARLARGRYILFLNPDTRVVGDALGAMCRTLDERPAIGAVGARILTPQMTWSRENGYRLPTVRTIVNEYLGLSRLAPALFPGIVRSRDFEGLDACEWLCGAALMVRRPVFEQEQWDERIFLFAEDLEYCCRIGARGWGVAALADAGVVHYGGQSVRQNETAVPTNEISGLTSIIRRRQGPLAAWLASRIVRTSMRLRSWFHAARYRLAGDELALVKAKRLRAYLTLERDRP